MITATRITRALGVLGAVGFLAHATASLATTGASYQDANLPPEPAPAASAVDDAPLPAAPEPIKDLPPAPSADAAPLPSQPEPVKDLPPPPDEPALDVAFPTAEPIVKSEPLGAAKAEAAPSAAPTPLPAEDPNPLPPARELTSRPMAPAPPAMDDEEEPPVSKPTRRTTTPRSEPTDDPDAEARSFVERNRREAQEQLKALREEAAVLKGRLARVENGIRRWESLADAMERSAQDKTAAAIGDDPRAVRSRGVVQYGVPMTPSGGVIIQSQPATRSDFVPVPGPR